MGSEGSSGGRRWDTGESRHERPRRAPAAERRWSRLLTVLLLVPLVAAATGSRAAAAGPPGRPNVVMLMIDRRPHARAVPALDAQDTGPPRAVGYDLRRQRGELPRMLPVPGDPVDGAVRAQPRGAVRQLADRRLHQARSHQHAAGVAARRRLPHRPDRQVPERVRGRRSARHPSGLGQSASSPWSTRRPSSSGTTRSTTTARSATTARPRRTTARRC